MIDYQTIISFVIMIMLNFIKIFNELANFWCISTLKFIQKSYCIWFNRHMYLYYKQSGINYYKFSTI